MGADGVEFTEDGISFYLKGDRTHIFDKMAERFGNTGAGNGYEDRAELDFSVGEECIVWTGDAYGTTRGAYVVKRSFGDGMYSVQSGRRRPKLGSHCLLKMNERNLREVMVDSMRAYANVATARGLISLGAGRTRGGWVRENLPARKDELSGLIREYRRRYRPRGS